MSFCHYGLMLKLDQPLQRPAGAFGLPQGTLLLTACIAVVGANSLALGPIAPSVAESFHAEVQAVLWATSAFGLGTSASALFLARYIDRLGARRALRLALALFAAALLAASAAPAVSVLIAAQLVAGLACGVALPAIYASAAAISPGGRESRTIGVVLTGWTVSMVAGVALSALIADFLDWRLVFLLAGLLAALISARLRRADLSEQTSAQAAPSPFEALRLPGVVPLLVACCAFMAAFYGIYGYLGDHVHHGLGEPLSANGLLALVYGSGFGLAVLLDGLADRFGARLLLPLAFGAVTCVYAAMALPGAGFAALLGLVFVWGLANHLGLNLLILRLTALDPARRGTIMGLNSAVTYLAVFLGTAGFGPAYVNQGFAPAALLAAALTLVAAAAAAWSPLLEGGHAEQPLQQQHDNQRGGEHRRE